MTELIKHYGSFNVNCPICGNKEMERIGDRWSCSQGCTHLRNNLKIYNWPLWDNNMKPTTISIYKYNNNYRYWYIKFNYLIMSIIDQYLN